MSAENTGTFVNSAEINSVDESDGMKDVDSNKKESEDDYSKAQLIISVNTGLAMYISIGVIIATIIVLTALGIKFKWKIGKISKMGLSVLVIVISGMIATYNPVEAMTVHYYARTPHFGMMEVMYRELQIMVTFQEDQQVRGGVLNTERQH